MKFDFATANKIIFGPGRLQEIGPLARAAGQRALVATNLGPKHVSRLLNELDGAGVSYIVFDLKGEPTVASVQEATGIARAEACNLTIGFGGGSAIDTAKATAALLTNPGDVLDYLEVVGKGQKLRVQPVPCLAVPTTAGTGAEVTRNAVLGVPEQRVKVSLRDARMLPRVALVDPELTYSVPPADTASTGLDALTQLIEPFVSIKANPLTDALCRSALPYAAWALPRVYKDGSDTAARADMALASLFGGLALANAKLGAVHGFAGPLGGLLDAPHGAICAALLPHVMAVNLAALRDRAAGTDICRRFDEVARLLTGDPQATAADGVEWLAGLVHALNIPSLGAYGLSTEMFPELVASAAKASSMQGNPIELTEAELYEIVERAC